MHLLSDGIPLADVRNLSYADACNYAGIVQGRVSGVGCGNT